VKTLNIKLFAVIGMLTVASIVAGIVAGPLLAAAVKAALIKNVDEPGRLPYEAHATFQPAGCISSDCSSFITNGTTLKFNLPASPVGKRLIIKSVTAFLPANSGTGLAISLANNSVGKWAYYGPFTPTLGNYNMNSQNTFFTYEPGEKPVVIVISPNFTALLGEVSVNGYLIDASN
jgi:hypothetical protein